MREKNHFPIKLEAHFTPTKKWKPHWLLESRLGGVFESECATSQIVIYESRFFLCICKFFVKKFEWLSPAIFHYPGKDEEVNRAIRVTLVGRPVLFISLPLMLPLPQSFSRRRGDKGENWCLQRLSRFAFPVVLSWFWDPVTKVGFNSQGRRSQTYKAFKVYHDGF